MMDAAVHSCPTDKESQRPEDNAQFFVIEPKNHRYSSRNEYVIGRKAVVRRVGYEWDKMADDERTWIVIQDSGNS